MIEFTASMTVLFLVVVTAWYVPLIWYEKVNPAPATYIIGTMAMWIAMISYHVIPERTIVENITLYVGAFQVTIILLVIIYVYVSNGSWKLEFDWVQKTCLTGIVVALIYWYFNQGQSHVVFWGTQILLVFAYVATIIRAFQRKIAFDAIGNWGFICMASIFGSFPAVVMMSPYGIGNSLRAVIASGLTMSLLIYYDKRSGYSRWQIEKQTLTNFYGNVFK
ncbi:MAG: hypothetical protein WD471_01920 [Candidatus Paceibacterota bacterium]